MLFSSIRLDSLLAFAQTPANNDEGIIYNLDDEVTDDYLVESTGNSSDEQSLDDGDEYYADVDVDNISETDNYDALELDLIEDDDELDEISDIEVTNNLIGDTFNLNHDGSIFTDPQTGITWRVLVSASDSRGGRGNMLLITEHVHMTGPYHNNIGFTPFINSNARTNVENWFNNPDNVGLTLRGMVFDYEFQNATGGSIPRTSTALGAGIEVDRPNGSNNHSGHVPTTTNVLRGRTRLIPETEGNGMAFILSTSEANEYFTDNAHRQALVADSPAFGNWWLRSPSGSTVAVADQRHAVVATNGGIATGIATTAAPGLRPAVWIRGNSTVTFNTHGGSAVPNQTMPNNSLAIRPADPTRDGYTFSNWFTTPNGLELFDFNNYIYTDRTAHAQWTEAVITHDVTFMWNYPGNTSVFATRTIPHGQSIANNTVGVSMPNDPIRPGYTMAWSWNSGTNAPFIDTTPITSSFNIFAHWSTNSTRTITFDLDGGNIGGVITNPTRQVRDGQSISNSTVTPINNAMPANPERPTYTFTGWEVTNDAGGMENGDTPTNAQLLNQILTGGDVTVTAQWDPILYTVDFDLHDGDSHADFANQSIQQGQTVQRPTTDPTRPGHQFYGWFDNSTSSAPSFNFDNPITGNTTIHAVWGGVISFDANANGDTVNHMPADSTLIRNGQPFNVPTTEPERTGYRFDGWYTTSSIGGSQVTTPHTVNGNQTLYARWTQLVTISFMYNYPGDSGVFDTVTIPYGQSIANNDMNVTMPSDPTRHGHTFDIWYYDSFGTIPFDPTTGINSNMNIYASWEQIPHTVTFDLQHGETNVAFADQIVLHGEFATEPPIIPERLEYTFEGWYVYVETVGIVAFDFDTMQITADTTIYATWSAISHGGGTPPAIGLPHLVRFYVPDTNGDLEMFHVQLIHEGQLTTAPLLNPVRNGYDFTGWYTTETGNTRFDFATMTIVGETNIYGRWIAHRTVEFDLQGGEADPAFNEQIILHGELATAPTINPVREGHTFIGWYTEPIGGTAFDFATPITADTTIYARWELPIGPPMPLPVPEGETPIFEIEVDEDGNVTLPEGPDWEYEIDEDGNIIIELPPGVDEDDLIVTIPPGWEWEVIEDEDGNLILVITPPTPIGPPMPLPVPDGETPEVPVIPGTPGTPGLPTPEVRPTLPQAGAMQMSTLIIGLSFLFGAIVISYLKERKFNK